MTLTTGDVRRIRELRYEDGLTAPQVAAIVGCYHGTVLRYAPGLPGKVPNGPLREAFERSSLTASQVAKRMGWWGGGGWDGSRVKRTLGLAPDVSGTRRNGTIRRYMRSRIDAETAYDLADILGVDRWELEP